jgi:glutamate formiminotransferase
MNLTDFEVTPPHVVYDRIMKEAAARGVSVAEFELVGLIPRAAAAHLDIPESLILENRIAEESASGR